MDPKYKETTDVPTIPTTKKSAKTTSTSTSQPPIQPPPSTQNPVPSANSNTTPSTSSASWPSNKPPSSTRNLVPSAKAAPSTSNATPSTSNATPSTSNASRPPKQAPSARNLSAAPPANATPSAANSAPQSPPTANPTQSSSGTGSRVHIDYSREGILDWFGIGDLPEDAPEWSNKDRVAKVFEAVVAVARKLFRLKAATDQKWEGKFANLPLSSSFSETRRKPDIVIVKRHIKVGDDERDGERLDWLFIEAILELKVYSTDLTKEDFVKIVGAQLAEKVYCILEAQENRRYVPTSRLVGSTCRFCIFNRGGAIYSCGFNIFEKPELLLHIIIGLTFAPNICLGYDPTLRYVSPSIIKLILPAAVQSRLTMSITKRKTPGINQRPTTEMELRPRPIKKPSRVPKIVSARPASKEPNDVQLSAADMNDGDVRIVIINGMLYKIRGTVYRSVMIVGRATQCWFATRNGRIYFIKDSWPLVTLVPNEVDLFLIAQAVGVRNIPELLDWEDVMVNDQLDSCDNNRGSHVEALDCIHRRQVFDGCADPIFFFTCRRELVSAFLDYIIALYDLIKKAGILHQDVSIFNLLLKNDGRIIRRGLLSDFDYALLMDELRRRLFKISEIGTTSLPRKGLDGKLESAPVVHKVMDEASGHERLIRQMNIKEYEDEVKQKGVRTGTHLFMAGDILINPNTEHKPHHDLESGFFGFVYMCGMFEGPNDQQRSDLIPTFINNWMQNHDRSPEAIGYLKRGWLSQSETEMTASMLQFTDYMLPLRPLVLALQKTLSDPQDRSQVTHKNWIAIFKDFLKNTTFDDDPIPCPPYEEPPPITPSPKAPVDIPPPWAQTPDVPVEPPVQSDPSVLVTNNTDVKRLVENYQRLHQKIRFWSVEKGVPSSAAGLGADSEQHDATGEIQLPKPQRTGLMTSLEFDEEGNGDASKTITSKIPIAVRRTQAGRTEVFHPKPTDIFVADTMLNYLSLDQTTNVASQFTATNSNPNSLKGRRKTSAPPAYSSYVSPAAVSLPKAPSSHIPSNNSAVASSSSTQVSSSTTTAALSSKTPVPTTSKLPASTSSKAPYPHSAPVPRPTTSVTSQAASAASSSKPPPQSSTMPRQVQASSSAAPNTNTTSSSRFPPPGPASMVPPSTLKGTGAPTQRNAPAASSPSALTPVVPPPASSSKSTAQRNPQATSSTTSSSAMAPPSQASSAGHARGTSQNPAKNPSSASSSKKNPTNQ